MTNEIKTPAVHPESPSAFDSEPSVHAVVNEIKLRTRQKAMCLRAFRPTGLNPTASKKDMRRGINNRGNLNMFV
eukprot:CAMPEP_0194506994 /NCGR_PEP_ID=MMETSP0253-20130528/35801_1 /TAXON_ID=2966 /ORGANISM="Noctiluca scintillans" /LENGTH=73 /DNA_ID=CAMNT_0039349803 /DNA_START=138 /DNA_END=356 /DNA_ORIENTATION=-